MALGSKKTGFLVIVSALAGAPAQALDFPARHNHWRGGCAGILSIDADGIAFRQVRAKKQPHAWRWTWDAVQQFELGDDRRVRVLTYQDRALALGRDRDFEFRLDGAPDLAPAYELLSRVMDQRFVARMNVPGRHLQWEIPVKRLRGNGGLLGRLRVYEDRIVFAASAPGQSRTWRDSDIELISSDSPFRLLLATHEKNGRFNFQLRHRLEPARYEALWLRLESHRGLRLLNEPSRSGLP
ncbi:MAG: hypothetical protein KatS3mg004_2972 [Bryobacteraceae bacterium]|nr:MAG: hypothetical protein KatS3mg004_2972 [Bryobacteraceae bacterium]